MVGLPQGTRHGNEQALEVRRWPLDLADGASVDQRSGIGGLRPGERPRFLKEDHNWPGVGHSGAEALAGAPEMILPTGL